MKKLILLFASIFLVSCSSNTPEEKAKAPAKEPVAQAKSNDASPQESEPTSAKKELFGTAKITGTILFKGDVPSARRDPSASMPECQVKDGDEKPADFAQRHDALRAKDGKLLNAFVYVKEGISKSAVYPTPDKAVELDQRYCAYRPRVLGMQKNQTLLLVNSDPGLHNVHSMSTESKNFNLGMPIKDMKMSRTFANEEVMVRMKCDVHPWMAAYVGVLSHPFFSVSNESGSFELNRLPEGKYTIAAWHEKLGTKEKEVTVKEGEAVSLDFDFTN